MGFNVQKSDNNNLTDHTAIRSVSALENVKQQITKAKTAISTVLKETAQKIFSESATNIRESTNVVCSDPLEPMGPLQNAEKPQLVGMENGVDPGKKITYEFKHQGKVYGKETVDRIDVIKDLQRSLTTQLNFLTEKRNELIQKGRSTDQIESQIQLYQKSLSNIQNMSKDDFVKSSFYRDELQKIISSGRDYQTAIDDICLGAAVNFRYQQCEALDKTIGFFRLGIITDPRNGFTHLGEMREMANEPGKLQNKISELKKEFNKLQQNPKKNAIKLAAYSYALSQLETNNLGKAIQERQHVLSNQMFQLVQGQVEKNLQKIVDSASDEFDITHLALLNRKTDAVDATGWVHNEANEMADMNEIFKDFAGKKLIFDGEGPYIDDQGHLHISQILSNDDGTSREVTLKTNFVNISVQGYNKNDGIQEQINDVGMDQIIDIAKHRFIENINNPECKAGLKMLLDVKKELEAGKSNYQIAEKLSIALIKLDMPMSMGCLSAKDRTGYVGARAVLHFVAEDMAKDPKLDSKAHKRIVHSFETNILDKDGCAALVVKDNTKITVLKCSAFDLPGYTTKDAKGTARRLKYYAEQFGAHPTIIAMKEGFTS